MHFFIEHTQLTTQASSGDSFGPSSADPTNKYDVSANFQLASGAKAFACQPGHIIVTDYFDVTAGALDPGLVNVIPEANGWAWGDLSNGEILHLPWNQA